MAESEASPLLVEQDGPVIVVTLNRPNKLNAVNAELHDALGEVWSSIGRRSDVSAVILTGAGRAFSAGNDPTTPALHCAITRSGTEMMNSGAPIAGMDRRPLNKAGIDMGENSFLLRDTGCFS